jgi:hypothetical protein
MSQSKWEATKSIALSQMRTAANAGDFIPPGTTMSLNQFTTRWLSIREQAEAWFRDYGLDGDFLYPYTFRDAHPGMTNAEGLNPGRYTLDDLLDESGYRGPIFSAWQDWYFGECDVDDYEPNEYSL